MLDMSLLLVVLPNSILGLPHIILKLHKSNFLNNWNPLCTFFMITILNYNNRTYRLYNILKIIITRPSTQVQETNLPGPNSENVSMEFGRLQWQHCNRRFRVQNIKRSNSRLASSFCSNILRKLFLDHLKQFIFIQP